MSGLRLLAGIDRKRPDGVDAQFVDHVRHARPLVFLLDGLTHRTAAFYDRRDVVRGTSFAGAADCWRAAKTAAVVPGCLLSTGSLS